MVYLFTLTISILKNRKINHKTQNSNLQSVSVIICAKNEKENLQKNLPLILHQNYPDFEVIVVDDGSDEQLTMNHETSSGQADERLTIIRISKEEKHGLGKKYALQKGIEAAKKDLILLTDADCRPVSENWIMEMVSCIDEKKKIVLGISPYQTESGILNSLIEYETAQTALQYLGFALLGMPYMCVGRNVLYDAKLVKTKKWTDTELSIASGDDDLMIQSLATKENTTVCLSKDSYTKSEAKKTWKAWIQQKLRHYESGKVYKFSHRFILGSYLLAKTGFYTLLIWLLFCFPAPFNFIIGIFIFYFIAITVLQFMLNFKLYLNQGWYLAVIDDLLYCIFTITLGVISHLKPAKNWK